MRTYHVSPSGGCLVMEDKTGRVVAHCSTWADAAAVVQELNNKNCNRAPTMKKYIFFGYDNYYPIGGMSDIHGSFDTLEEARTAKANTNYDESYIIDRDTWEEVE